jgi:hypothetical protein
MAVMRSSRTCRSITSRSDRPTAADLAHGREEIAQPRGVLRERLAEQLLVASGVGGDLEVVGRTDGAVGRVELDQADPLQHAEVTEQGVHRPAGRQVPRLVERHIEVVDDLRPAHLPQEVVGVASGKEVLLQHEHAEAGPRQASRGGKAAETRADHDHVPVGVDTLHA